jgi:branched-chain amino acid transport system ATP-binding protein
MLKINNIVVKYGNAEALRGVSMVVQKGKITTLLGSNGAGKTTTINAISGINKLVSGTIVFDNKDISMMPAHERVQEGIIQVPEGRKLFPYLSVLENLLVGSYLPRARKKRREMLDYCFDLFPRLSERKNQMAHSLSGGEQQMCAIARGLMQCPQILMLDEPSLGLAPKIVDEIFGTLVEINQQGTTVLLVEQNVLASLDISHYAYVIEIGKNALEGHPKELKQDESLKNAYLGI